jgi:NAD(P)-dependent dehydrogenase (short-subunit alcohol dehydrogenase family)
MLVNNAGRSIRIPHADLKATTPAVWRRVLDINLIALRADDRGRASAAVNPPTAGARPAS